MGGGRSLSGLALSADRCIGSSQEPAEVLAARTERCAILPRGTSSSGGCFVALQCDKQPLADKCVYWGRRALCPQCFLGRIREGGRGRQGKQEINTQMKALGKSKSVSDRQIKGTRHYI